MKTCNNCKYLISLKGQMSSKKHPCATVRQHKECIGNNYKNFKEVGK